jgi:signal transduction histidine kinase
VGIHIERDDAAPRQEEQVLASEDRVLSEREVDRENRLEPPHDGARRILEAADSARRRLARDLHDGAQQQFVTAVINLQLAQAKFAGDPDRAKRHLDTALQQAESGLAALRDLVTGIHPPILTHLGLNAAVQSCLDGLPIPVRLEITDERLPPGVEESMYFFVSEALTNVVKHAHASSAAILIARTNTIVNVEVSDDGVGGADLHAGGSGLMGLVDRMHALGGDLTIASPPTGGTVLRGVIPMPAEPV